MLHLLFAKCHFVTHCSVTGGCRGGGWGYVNVAMGTVSDNGHTSGDGCAAEAAASNLSTLSSHTHSLSSAYYRGQSSIVYV